MDDDEILGDEDGDNENGDGDNENGDGDNENGDDGDNFVPTEIPDDNNNLN